MDSKGIDQKIKSNLLSRKEAAAYLGVTPHTLAVWQCKERYGLPCIKIGRLSKYTQGHLDEFIRQRTLGVDRKEGMDHG